MYGINDIETEEWFYKLQSSIFVFQGHEFLFYAILMISAMILFMLMSTKYKYKCVTDT